MKHFATLLAVLLTVATIAQSGVVLQWQRSYGGNNIDHAGGIRQTADGGYIAAGRASSATGDVSTINGSYDVWLVKLDASGNLLWEKNLGGSGSDEATSIDVTTDGGYFIVGYTLSNDGDVSTQLGDGDIWAVKTDALGNIEWERTLGGSQGEYPYATGLQTMDGGYVVSGVTLSIDGDIIDPQGGTDFLVVKLDANGETEWARTLGGSDYEYVLRNIIQTTDGGYVIAGGSGSDDGHVSFNHGLYDLWLVKLDANGEIVWENSYGGSEWDEPRAIAQTSDGGFIVASSTDSWDGDVSEAFGLEDYWIVKFDHNGNLQWERSFGGSGIDIPTSIIQTADGGYITAGHTSSMDGHVMGNNGDMDVWMIKLAWNGELEWQRCFGGTGSEMANEVIMTSDGGFVFAGASGSTDGDVTVNNGAWDFWIVKLTTDFNTIQGTLFIDLNSNAVYDAGEPVLGAHPVTESNTGRMAISGSNGFYDLNVLEDGAFTSGPAPLMHYTPVPATHNVQFTDIGGTDEANHHAFQPIGNVDDLLCTITPLGAFRPGFDAHYRLHYRNVGTTTQPAVTLVFHPDPEVTFLSASVVPTFVTADSIVWEITGMQPFDEENILVTVQVSVDAVLGSEVSSAVMIASVLPDAVPENNQDIWPVVVTGSYDPNDIQVDRSMVLFEELDDLPWLEYLIRFQNTGNDTAFTVRIAHTLPDEVELSSFTLNGSSHLVEIGFDNATQELMFQFNNILLPDSNINEPESHGYVRYRIRLRNDLALGDLVESGAAIYFDYNAPVITNTASTEIVTLSGISDIGPADGLLIYPNPATHTVTITMHLGETGDLAFQLFNATGQLVHSSGYGMNPPGRNQWSISTGHLPSGVYQLRIHVGGSMLTRRVVKM